MFKEIAFALAVAATTTVAAAQGTSTYNKPIAKPATQAAASAKRHKAAAKVETQATLRKEAKISEASARAAALKEVPNGRVKSSELEREKGKLIYSYDITIPGKSGIEEVNVDAMDGAVVAKVHESAKTEKKEAAQEAKAKKATK
ncbi:MAG: PepSY domain-containing protein [Gemmatimonadaceae bacterium]